MRSMRLPKTAVRKVTQKGHMTKPLAVVRPRSHRRLILGIVFVLVAGRNRERNVGIDEEHSKVPKGSGVAFQWRF